MKRLSRACYALIITALLFLFFTNDFGIIDIRKTSFVVALGVDGGGETVNVTAQIATPESSQSGGERVSGEGKTVGEALDKINVKTGFYPKLTFCNLIIIGESARGEHITKTLDYFYRSDYIPRTALVCTCRGEAGELLAETTQTGEAAADVITRCLSEELQKTANVSAVNLKDVAVACRSEGASCYLPYVDFSPAEGSSEGGSEGGEQSGGGSQESGSESGEKSGSSQDSAGANSKSGSQSGGGAVEFFCNRAALFGGGYFSEVLTEGQSFALNILTNDVRLAVLPFELDGKAYAMGLKKNKGGVKIKIEDGAPVIVASYKAKGEVRNVSEQTTAEEVAGNALTSPEVLQAAQKEITERITGLFEECAKTDCDALQLKRKLRANHYKYYEKYGESILTAPVKIEVKITSNN